jgi:hypothetical protein
MAFDRKLYMKEYRNKNKEHIKEIAKYHRDKNKIKMKVYRKKYNVEKKDLNKNYTLKKRYNLSLEEFNNKLINQNNTCAICKKPFKNSKTTHVDHSHITNVVRDLLCFKCNNVIGHANDNIPLLKSAIEYLKRHECQ